MGGVITVKAFPFLLYILIPVGLLLGLLFLMKPSATVATTAVQVSAPAQTQQTAMMTTMRTTMRTTTHCPIDCNAGYNDLGPHQWVKGWSAARKIYCCRTANRGCPSELPPPSGAPPSGIPGEPDTFQYDCNAGYHHCSGCLKLQWSPAKIQFCCSTQHKGCSAMR